jgi:excisionase family DNA binding protein
MLEKQRQFGTVMLSTRDAILLSREARLESAKARLQVRKNVLDSRLQRARLKEIVLSSKSILLLGGRPKMTAEETASYLEDNRNAILRLVLKGVLPATRKGEKLRVRRSDLNRMIESHKLPPAAN